MAKKKSKRPGKGESLFKFIENYTVVDLETTGLNPAVEVIIEIGAIRIRDGKEEARFSELINPGRPISDFITDLTGITNSDLSGARNTSDVMTDFLEFLGNDIILGHNVNFDVNFLYDTCLRTGLNPITNNFIDTMRISRKVLHQLHHHLLKDLAENFNIDYSGAHRAVFDCEVTYKAYQAMFPD